ncbi:MAG: hypothetical protein WD058_09750 [Dehalococcoidia bacterium]
MRHRLRRPATVLGGLVLLGAAAACGGGEGDATATAGAGDLPVEMHVRWEVDDAFPATVTLHEPPPDQDLYEVHTYPEGEPPAVGDEIPAGILHGRHSEPTRFVALLQNEAPEAVRFWVAPHLPVPHIEEQGLLMFCLCTGEVYEVPAGGSWTRVMEFGVTRRSGLQGPLVLTHVIVRGDLAAPTPAAAQ